MRWTRRIERTRAGDFRLRLTRGEREALRPLPAELRRMLAADDPTLVRLFPPAYEDDPDGEAEYRRLMRDELLSGRLAALRVMEATIDAERLSEDEAHAWLGALNDLRLALGTRLGVTEETFEHGLDRRDARAGGLALYAYLTWLEEQVVEAVASQPAGER